MVFEEINSNENSRLLAAIRPHQEYASTSQNVSKFINNLITQLINNFFSGGKYC